MSKRFFSGFLFLTISIFSNFIFAGAFNVTPTKILLSSKNPITILQVKNEGNDDVVVQLSIKQWQQQKGQDVYAQTNDVMATPPLFRLPAGKTQIIRIAYVDLQKPMEEKAYRIYLQEVIPQIKPLAAEPEQLTIALRVSIPIFWEPEQPAQTHLIWHLQKQKQSLKVTMENNGNRTLFINQLQLLNSQDKPISRALNTFAYIFPGQSHQWLFTENKINAPSKIKYISNSETAVSDFHR